MSKKKKEKIIDLILSSDFIIKKRTEHTNGDTSIRFGRGEIIKNQQKPPLWFTTWASGLEKQLNVIETKVDVIETRLDVIEKDIQLIKNTPTMKKELT